MANRQSKICLQLYLKGTNSGKPSSPVCSGIGNAGCYTLKSCAQRASEAQQTENQWLSEEPPYFGHLCPARPQRGGAETGIQSCAQVNPAPVDLGSRRPWWDCLCCLHLIKIVCVCAKSLQSCLFATPRTGAHEAPLSMAFSRQEHGSGLPCPSPGDLPD